MSKKPKPDKKKPTKYEILKRHRLPTKGSYPFEPDKGWFPTQPLNRGPQGGYMDKHGREWTKGSSKTPGEDWEWDVQLPDGGHLNIDWQGTETHGGS